MLPRPPGASGAPAACSAAAAVVCLAGPFPHRAHSLTHLLSEQSGREEREEDLAYRMRMPLGESV